MSDRKIAEFSRQLQNTLRKLTAEMGMAVIVRHRSGGHSCEFCDFIGCSGLRYIICELVARTAAPSTAKSADLLC